MNESSWASLSLDELPRELCDRITARKARLIACAAAREFLQAMGFPANEAIVLAERYADGQATAHQMASMRHGGRFLPTHVAWPVCWAPDSDHLQMMRRALAWATGFFGGQGEFPGYSRIASRLAPIVIDVVGPPALPGIDPAWRVWDGGTIVKLAESIYHERSYEQMPILGDALEEAGCSSRQLLDHCRHPSKHYRGCWLLDEVLELEDR